MKKNKIWFWIFTGIFSALILMASIPDILVVPGAVTFMSDHLGYPHYFIAFIGVLKVLGIIAILIPGYPRIKEWAYAGFAYDLFGAVYSQIAVGDPVSKWGFMFLWILTGAGSYYFYHQKSKPDTVNFT